MQQLTTTVTKGHGSSVCPDLYNGYLTLCWKHWKNKHIQLIFKSEALDFCFFITSSKCSTYLILKYVNVNRKKMKLCDNPFERERKRVWQTGQTEINRSYMSSLSWCICQLHSGVVGQTAAVVSASSFLFPICNLATPTTASACQLCCFKSPIPSYHMIAGWSLWRTDQASQGKTWV